jgi:hypothetical protein
MKTRFAALLLALALPIAAQEPAASPTEAIFYKAFYLEKGQMDYAGAMVLYDQFLAAAPEHALAAKAAQQQYMLLDKTGKTKERDAFRAKYGKLIGDVALLGDRPARPGADGAGPGARRGDGPGRPDPAARMAELEQQLADAKAAGDDDKVKELEQQIARMKQMGDRARGQGGGRGVLFGDKKLADMSADELKQVKDGIGMMEGRVDRMRERMGDEAADKLQANIDSLKKALDANKLEDAQKVLDEMKAGMMGGRGGRPGAGGGDAGSGGRQRGGGGGN